MKIVTVLRSGGEYHKEHVIALSMLVKAWAPAEFMCLSDVRIPGIWTVPLKHDWPGWWAKMELFRPELRGDFLYMDLDTVVTDFIDDLDVRTHTVLQDFYFDGRALRRRMASGLMYLTEACRAPVWVKWQIAPKRAMAECAHGGDQRFLETVWGPNVPRWQDVRPGCVVSYKVDCCEKMLGGKLKFKGVPEKAAVVCFHGRPRPWDTAEFKHLYG